MKKKKIILITLVFTLLICFFCFLPKEKSVSKKIKTISYEHPEYKERYTLYKSKHPHLTKEEIITLVNMNRDYDFYDHIIKQDEYSANGRPLVTVEKSTQYAEQVHLTQ